MKSNVWKRLLYIGLCCIAAVYAFVLVKIILLKYGFTTEFRSVQPIPFRFAAELLRPSTSLDVALKNVLGNFALFIPLGILLPALFPRLTFGKTVLIGALTSLGFELIQLTVGLGATDIDDLLLNSLGCLAGASLYYGLLLHSGKLLRARLASFLVLAVFGCCGILALWLYAPNMLPTQIIYENEEALNGIDSDSYDVSALCTGFGEQCIMLRPGDAAKSEYSLAEDALILLEHYTYQYSPNGNIQKMTIRYEKATATAAAEALAGSDQGAGFADIWLNADDACETLVLTIFEN